MVENLKVVTYVYILPYPHYKMKIIKLTCKHCGKIIESLYEAQAEYNHKQHEENCNKKEEKK